MKYSTNFTHGNHMPRPEPDLKRLQNIELSMFKNCLSIFEKHHIRYFLIHGSALGAVRHSGFIPWDDDIDIGIPRPDYDKFISIAAAELAADYFLQTSDTDPLYPNCFAKVRDSKTTFIQSNVSHLSINQGIYIDVFPLDGYPSHFFMQRILKILVNIFCVAIYRKLNVPLGTEAVSVNNTISHFLEIIISSCFSISGLRRVVAHLTRAYKYEKCDVVINWHGSLGTKEAVPKLFFERGDAAHFEGLVVQIPKKPDAYLRALYGDYMTLPPIEDRISHHYTDVVDLDNSYTNYDLVSSGT